MIALDLDIGLVVSAFTLGLRHGVDWDHIAAITDLTGGERNPRRALRSATLYALGHAAVVLALGTLAIAAGDFIPESIDAAMGRVVGVTLIVLGAWLLFGLVRDRRRFRLRSRWMMLSDLISRLRNRHRGEMVVIEHEHEHDHDGAHAHRHDHAPVHDDGAHPTRVRTTHRHRHVHRGVLPADPFAGTTTRVSLAVGMLHGIGAETPTQVVLFLAAAESGGVLSGELVLVSFLAGLFASNTAIAVTSAFGFLNARRHFRVYATIGVVTAAISLTVGVLLITGSDSILPELFGG